MSTKILIACNSRGRMLDACLSYPILRQHVWGVVSDSNSESLAVAARHSLAGINIANDDDELLSSTILSLCIENSIAYILSVGFTRIFRGKILKEFYGRILNSHFSILPAFPGTRRSDWTATRFPPRLIFERALAYGSRITGNTIHLVSEAIDGGAPIIQSSLIIPYDEDSVATRHRLYIQECQCLMQVIVWLANNRLVLRNDHLPRILNARFDHPNFSPGIEESWILTFNPSRQLENP